MDWEKASKIILLIPRGAGTLLIGTIDLFLTLAWLVIWTCWIYDNNDFAKCEYSCNWTTPTTVKRTQKRNSANYATLWEKKCEMSKILVIGWSANPFMWCSINDGGFDFCANDRTDQINPTLIPSDHDDYTDLVNQTWRTRSREKTVAMDSTNLRNLWPEKDWKDKAHYWKRKKFVPSWYNNWKDF